MLVALERLDLRIPGCGSLKQKRHVVRSLENALRSRFNVSVAEVDHHDLWQRTVLGVSQVGTDTGYVDGALRAVVRFIDDLHVAEVGEEHIEFFHC